MESFPTNGHQKSNMAKRDRMVATVTSMYLHLLIKVCQKKIPNVSGGMISLYSSV